MTQALNFLKQFDLQVKPNEASSSAHPFSEAVHLAKRNLYNACCWDGSSTEACPSISKNIFSTFMILTHLFTATSIQLKCHLIYKNHIYNSFYFCLWACPSQFRQAGSEDFTNLVFLQSNAAWPANTTGVWIFSSQIADSENTKVFGQRYGGKIL